LALGHIAREEHVGSAVEKIVNLVMRFILNKKGISTITIDSNMQDHRNDPFIVKKAEKARAFIEKHGLPKKGRSKKNK
jgi:hypothetical protein